MGIFIVFVLFILFAILIDIVGNIAWLVAFGTLITGGIGYIIEKIKKK